MVGPCTHRSVTYELRACNRFAGVCVYRVVFGSRIREAEEVVGAYMRMSATRMICLADPRTMVSKDECLPDEAMKHGVLRL